MGRWQKDAGDDYFVVESAGVITYPSGEGGSTTTAGSSLFATAPLQDLVLVSVSASASVAGTVLLENHAGADIITLDVAAGVPSTHLQLNMRLRAGLRVTTSAVTCSALLTFKKIRQTN